MIEIPEERILTDIASLLTDDLPKVLADQEEQSTDVVRLPPFKYVGDSGRVPPGTGLPHAFVEIEEGEYTEKDRIVRNRVYSVRIHLKLADMGLVRRYFAGVKAVLQDSNTSYRIKTDFVGKKSEMLFSIVW